MNNSYFETMMSIIRDAGQIYLDRMQDSHPRLKADNSVITDADKEISALTHVRLHAYIESGDHILIDEEDSEHWRYLDDAVLESSPYIWAIDPIDGTRAYANQMPLSGISLGLLRNKKPWMGVSYFPLMKELFVCDGDKAYFIQNAFTEQETRREIVVQESGLSRVSLFLTSDYFWKNFQWHPKDAHVLMPACAIVDLCWPTIGRGVGCNFHSSFWDFAGSWAILQKAGMDLRHYETGEVLSEVSVNIFRKDIAWKLKDYYIVSTAENFGLLKERLTR